jgi:hypothetical protein
MAKVYIDFQKGEIIPDIRLCNNTFFLYCRVYTTYCHILVVKCKLTYSSGSDMLIDSNFTFTTSFPKHWEYGKNSEYDLIVNCLDLQPLTPTKQRSIDLLLIFSLYQSTALLSLKDPQVLLLPL